MWPSKHGAHHSVAFVHDNLPHLFDQFALLHLELLLEDLEVFADGYGGRVGQILLKQAQALLWIWQFRLWRDAIAVQVFVMGFSGKRTGVVH